MTQKINSSAQHPIDTACQQRAPAAHPRDPRETAPELPPKNLDVNCPSLHKGIPAPPPPPRQPLIAAPARCAWSSITQTGRQTVMDLKIQLAKHPVARFVEARANERQIGLLAPQNRRAQAAADALLARVRHFMREHMQMSKSDIVQTMASDHLTRTGAVRPQDVPAALEYGNLREKMALVDNTVRALSSALLAMGAKAAADPAYYLQLEAAGLRIGVIVQKHRLAAALGSRRSYDSLVLDPRSPLQKLPSMRKNRTFVAVDRQTESTRTHLTHDLRTLHQTRLRGVDFDEHSALPLSEREKRNLVAGFASQLYEGGARDLSFEQIAHARLNLTEGAHGKKPNYDEPWVAEATTRGLPVSAGISGHTYRFMSLFHDLGGDPAQMLDLRLACLAFLVPAHHSYHEVMSSAAEFPQCPYDPDMDTAAKLVAQLRAEAGEPRVAKASMRATLAINAEQGQGAIIEG